MPARDYYHEHVRSALIKDGWTITHDPFRLNWGGKDLYVNLGAQRLIGAEKDHRRIAVEVKSFLGPSEMADLEKALGQFVLYRAILAERAPERHLYLAVPQPTLIDVFGQSFGELLLKNNLAQVVGFDPVKEEITQWLN